MFDDFFKGFEDIRHDVSQSILDLMTDPFTSWNNLTSDISHAVTVDAGNIVNNLVNGASTIFTNAVSSMSDVSSYLAQYGTLPPQQTIQQGVSVEYIQPRIQQPQQLPDYRPTNPSWGRTMTGSELLAANNQVYYNTVNDLNRPLNDGRIPNTGNNKYVGNVKYVYVSPDIGYMPESSTTQNPLKNAIDALGNTIVNFNMPDITSFVTDVGSVISSLVNKQDTMLSDFSSGIERLADVFSDPNSSIRTIQIDGLDTAVSHALAVSTESIVRDIPYIIGSVVSSINEHSEDLIRNLNEYEGSVNRSIEYTAEAIQKLSAEYEGTRPNEDIERLETLLTELLNPYSSLAAKFKAAVEIVDLYIRKLGDSVDNWFVDKWNESKFLLEHVFDYSKQVFNKEAVSLESVVDKLKRGGYTNSDEIWADLKAAGTSDTLFKFASALFTLVPAMGAFLGADLEPIIRSIRYATNAKYKGVIPDISLFSEAFVKDLIPESELYDNAAKLGYNDRHANLYANLSYEFLNPMDYRTLYLRGIIDETTHDMFLRRKGMLQEQIDLLKKTYELIPTPNDLISMAVRETFSPEIAEKFGQYEDFPEEFAFWAEKQGLTREWAQRYWASHWGLPSPMMGFEMLQRRIIDYPTLQLLLKSLDIMPFWRDKLTKLSYNPLTRVDVRRMYKLKVLNYDEMVNAYRDIGYNEDNAQKLALFTQRYETPTGETDYERLRDRVINSIERQYTAGKIDKVETTNKLLQLGVDKATIEQELELLDIERQEKIVGDKTADNAARILGIVTKGFLNATLPKDSARNYLISIGYTTVEADNEIALLQLERDAIEKSEYAKNIEELYSKRTITRVEATTLLSQHGFQAQETTNLLNNLDNKRDYRSKKPTEATILKAYKAGIITIDEYMEELRGLGYYEKYVQMLTLLQITGDSTDELQ